VESLLKDPVSTIVYVSTVREVEEIGQLLEDKLSDAASRQPMLQRIKVVRYHGSKNTHERHSAHTAFLSGAAQVLVPMGSWGGWGG